MVLSGKYQCWVHQYSYEAYVYLIYQWMIKSIISIIETQIVFIKGCEGHGISLRKKYIPRRSCGKKYSAWWSFSSKSSRFWTFSEVLWKRFEKWHIQRWWHYNAASDEMDSIRNTYKWLLHTGKKWCVVIWRPLVGGVFPWITTI